MNFKVIHGSELKGSVPGFNTEDNFFGKYSIKEYKELLTLSQEYFDGIKSGTISHDDNTYYIFAPKYYKTIDKASRIVKTSDDFTCISAQSLYFKDCVKVIKKEDGYYFSGHNRNGSHRFITAQKYHLYLLVLVENE